VEHQEISGFLDGNGRPKKTYDGENSRQVTLTTPDTQARYGAENG